MAGSFAEARAQIMSLRPAILKARAEQLRQFGIDARLAGSQLAASATEVGAQRGAPYAAYQERVAPTAAWLREIDGPATDTASGLQTAAEQGDKARMALAEQEQVLATLAANPATSPAQYLAAEAQALTVLNQAIGVVTQAYGAIAPPTPGTAPVVVAATGGGAGPGAGTGAGNASGFGGTSAALGTGAGDGAGDDGPPVGSGVALGPEAGPFAGFIQDPNTGNLIDPATGREVDPGGRFLDPITGQPFGEPSPFATRLEGLVGGVTAPGALPTGIGTGLPGAAVLGAGGVGVPPAGVIGPAAPGAPAVGIVPSGTAAGGGVVPFLPPGAVGAAGAVGGRTGRIAGLYGGAVPPSLTGANPASAQLNRIAARNLEHRAGVAQRYAAIASGQAPAQPAMIPPPIAGVGGGGTGAVRSARRSGPRAVTESAGVWGALPGSGRPDRRRRSGSSTETEDEDVWTGGGAVGADLLDGR